jgi:uncharacterized protein
MWGVGPSEPGVKRSLIWRSLNGLSMEHCELIQPAPDIVHLSGMTIGVQDDSPLRSFYSLEATGDWITQHVRVGHEHAMLELAVRDGRWFRIDHDHSTRSRQEHELPELSGCIDVDLGLTPATNTLPIRRLHLEIGQAATLTAAWVKFPSLDIVPLEQRYERLSKFSYRYSSTNFTALLEVDEFGLVTCYEGGWERIAASRGQ